MSKLFICVLGKTPDALCH